MPIIDRRSNLTPANARNADVASRLVHDIMPIAQQKIMAAFHVQGIEAVLYNRLTQGRRCTCNTQNNTVNKLSDDGKASPGAINRVLAGTTNFGVSNYSASPEEDFNNFNENPTSPNNPFDQWLGDLNTVGDHDTANEAEDGPSVGDNGQYSPDLDDIFDGFDMSHLGISDVSCPICFGAGYVGGYSMFRGYRNVLIPADFSSTADLILPSLELYPGTHSVTVVLPRGAVGVDVFRAMQQDKAIDATFTIDGTPAANRRILDWCDGGPHQIVITTTKPMSHFEMQFALSNESIYFEIPRLSKSADISLLEQQEPFQIIVSPDVPLLQSQDIIAESQLGKILIVGSVNPWNTRNRSMLGHECQVRVAQPQELWRIMPFRRPLTGQKPTNAVVPSRSRPLSGTAAKSFTV